MRSKQDEEFDEQEEFIHPPYPQLHLAFSENATYICRTLFLSTYGASSLFLKSVIGKVKKINTINFSRVKQQSLADLFQIEDALYLVFNNHLQPMRQVYLSKFIAEKIKFDLAVLLVAVPQRTLKETSTSHLSFISTSWWKEQQKFPRFQEGIMDIAGDFLQWGQLNKKAVVCFVGAVGEYELTSESVEAIFGVLRSVQGLEKKLDIGEEVRKFNMKKYSNKIYL